MKKEAHYNYDIQAWIINGHVARCGHCAPVKTCTACKWAGLTEEDRANAQIMAAAPEMLEALEAVTKELHMPCADYSCKICGKVKRAMDKAKGK